MKEIDKSLSREELRIKMCELRDEANMYSKELDRIDKSVNEEKYSKLINKCFRRYKDYEWYRIERYTENYELIGTIIIDFCGSDKMVSVDFNNTIWEENLEKSIEITNEEFNKKLEEVASLIKYIK